MKTLFCGFPNEYKINRITVPACYNCNQEYSKIDHTLRDLIGITNENDESLSPMTKSAIRNIFLSKKNGLERLEIDKDGIPYIGFTIKDIIDIHKKHFKGLFYHKFKCPLPDDFDIQIVCDLDEDKTRIEYANLICTLFDKYQIEWEASGHLDIFKYRISPIVIQDKSWEIVDYETYYYDYVICKMIYLNHMSAIIIAKRK